MNNLRQADHITLIVECEEELKNFLMRVKMENEKVGLKLSIQKFKIIQSRYGFPVVRYRCKSWTIKKAEC